MSLLLNPTLCTQHFEKPKLKTSKFGVREGLLVKKVPTEKREDLTVTQIHISLWTRLRDFEERGGIQKDWWDKF